MMHNNITKTLILLSAAALLTITAVSLLTSSSERQQDQKLDFSVTSTTSHHADAESKRMRHEYFFHLLRDPATNRIPKNIRELEVAFAKEHARKYKSIAQELFSWQEAGPVDVGGRTRALALDVTDNNTILAGGVSGGLWKSTDGGSSWSLKSNVDRSLAVTSVAQDPRPGNTDTWYYTTGEFDQSARDFGGVAFAYGTGIYKSTDNGETWSRLDQTEDLDQQFSSPYDYMSGIKVNPQTGSVFFTSNGFGLYRSSDGQTIDDEDPLASGTNPILGGRAEHFYAEVDIADDGTIVAALSERKFSSASSNEPGIFVSTDDGDTWTDVTPSSFTSQYERTAVAIAPSNTNIVYAYTYTGFGSGNNYDLRLHKIDLSNNTSTDLSDNVPNFGNPIGFMNPQGNYNLVVEVKPDDEDFVLIGTTNLFRSTDGFSTTPPDTDNDGFTDDSALERYWIGGYNNSNSGFGLYPNHHPDNHVLFFDLNDPNRLWSGHDGGISFTSDVRASEVTWMDMNQGYNVTQFYTIAISDDSGDDRLVGGTQDNGSPFFRYTENSGSTNSFDVSSGDGSFTHIGSSVVYSSSQNGRVLRIATTTDGTPTFSNFDYVHPSEAGNQQFIHPFVIDPKDENIMYYPDGNQLLRNTTLDQVSNRNSDGTTQGWENLTVDSEITSGYVISALTVTPGSSDILYYGASDLMGTNVPELRRMQNAASTDRGATDISINRTALEGAYIHDITVNPDNPNEIIAVFSNYRIPSVFHSTDGGSSWTDVEGSLASVNGNEGPSVRNARILPFDDDIYYVVATSTGVYSTKSLDGSNTVWTQEGSREIGYVVSNALDARTSDDIVAVGTHGRGAFVGEAMNVVSNEEESSQPELPAKFGLQQNYPNPFNPSTTIAYDIATISTVTLTLYNLQGQEVRTLISGATRSAGSYTQQLNASDLASGVYVYQLRAEPTNGGQPFVTNRKLTLVK